MLSTGKSRGSMSAIWQRINSVSYSRVDAEVLVILLLHGTYQMSRALSEPNFVEKELYLCTFYRALLCCEQSYLQIL